MNVYLMRVHQSGSEGITYVQELLGPVTGSVSQNCVCRNWPPGVLTQQEFALVDAVEQLWIEVEQVALPKMVSPDLALTKGKVSKGAKMASIEEAIIGNRGRVSNHTSKRSPENGLATSVPDMQSVSRVCFPQFSTVMANLPWVLKQQRVCVFETACLGCNYCKEGRRGTLYNFPLVVTRDSTYHFHLPFGEQSRV